MTNPRILLIEDEIRSQNLFVSCLQAEGYDTLTANDGFTGVQIAMQQLPDLVLCDIMMPQLDGYEVLTTLRQNQVTAIIPFIFLTAKASKLELRQGMNLGADDYLTKPIIVEELIEAIKARLRKHSLTDNSCAVTENTPSVDLSNLIANKTLQSFFPSLPHLSKIFSFIETNYSRGITLNDVAKAVGYSPAYLTNLVGKQTGKTINRWIIERRMIAACHLLQETNKSIENISREIGYQDPCHFSRQFRQHWQTTPQKWRNTTLGVLNK
jgi:YesN/AraC family two-component response regulator